jgi:RNA-directed DNA polymerase
VRDTPREEASPGVAGRPTQGEDIRGRWPWVKPEVWTERMLEALENGVKGGRWFSLMDKVYARKNLEVSWEQVRRNQGAAGVDGQSVVQFQAQTTRYLDELERELKEGTYRPQGVRRQWIPKPGSDKLRPLGIPTVKDRIVQTALRNAMEPIFENRFVEDSYGFRSGRGCKDALRRVDALLKAGYTHVVDADIQSYFDTIDHGLLLKEVEREVADGKVLELIGRYLKQQVLEDTKAWTPEAGTPQGAVISPLLANIYLHPVDVALKTAGIAMVRYADDLVILCRTEAEARQALERLEAEMSRRKLTLHPEKTRLVDAAQPGGFDFLGYHFERGYRWPRKKSLDKLKDTIRRHTPRTSGKSLQSIIEDINPVLRGWFGYFKHSHPTTFEPIDGWVRMRLRSILRKWQKQPGRGHGSDHQRWPNAYFAQQGLLTLKGAHARACQSRCRPH